MQKLIHFIILIFFISCGSDPDYQEVMVNKTIKVYSQAYHNEAEKGTIRGDFATSIGENAVHGSDSDENAEKEIGFFFTESELIANQ